MVFLHFSSNLTEEETMLQAKYEKLKRKKKALQTLKAPVREPERLTPVKRPQAEGRDAREIAQKLIKSGAIAAIKKQNKRDETTGFKRPGGGRTSGVERPRSENSGHHPFFNSNSVSAAANKVGVDTKLYDRLTPSTRDPDYPPAPVRAQVTQKSTNNNNSSSNSNNNSNSSNNSSVITNSTTQENVRTPSPSSTPSTPTTGGNTLFVQGYKINTQLLKKAFSDYGSILNISMESDKDRGFVTFEDPKCAAAALSALNGSVLAECQLTVSYARRQPMYNSDNSPDSNRNQKVWANAANRKNEKGSNKEFQGREIVSYHNYFD
ncbi:negative elongation factor E isoform X1 [Rhodnius prolixus]|uniref:Negative elongation factor E n=3 Tax=Rhodnius TaxID=13248 RepID=T1HWS2_RHOPR